MATKGIKLITRQLLGVLLGVLLCILGCIVAVATSDNGAQAPMRSLKITIDVNRREELFDQFRKFAEKHDFEISIRKVGVRPDGINIQMLRNDLRIIAIDVPKSPTEIFLRFHNKSPALPASQETVDELFSDLKSFLSEIPNITVTEEK